MGAYKPFSIDIDGLELKAQSEGMSKDGLYIDWATGITGWFESPPAKVSMTERGQGHGSFDIPDEAVLFSARTAVIGVVASAIDSDIAAALRRNLLSRTSRIVRVTVRDGEEETFAHGYITIKWTNSRLDHLQNGEITFVAANPRRYSTTVHTGYMAASGATDGGGLVYDAGQVLHWPLKWGEQAPRENLCTVQNHGTATAYPVITLSGDLEAGVAITGDGCELVYTQPVYTGSPVVLDCLSRIATINGVDVTRSLSSRTFPSVLPGGSLTLVLGASGTGSATVELRDTYI